MKYTQHTATDLGGTQYTYTPQDPHGVRLYRLENGLSLYLAKNTDAPRIQSFIAVRTGSNADPSDNTGLSHYLEHMLFKGTSKIGTLNWEKEKPLLDTLEVLFEEHKAEQDPEKKRQIYKEIDRVSHQASSYAVAGEYDQLMNLLGASGTNAHTWYDETVYKNNIPSTELERFLRIESERFSGLALRLFHTELESVYEEFNRAQDNDARQVNYALMEMLFPTHPNGQQTTLGRPEHLKNPSMKALREYFEQYYVPSNMALVLVGDLDFEESVQLVERYFGILPSRSAPQKPFIEEQPLSGRSVRHIYSPSTSRLHLAYRTPSYGTPEAMKAQLIASLLSNRAEAGLLDLEVNQKQKALYAGSYQMSLNHYGVFSLVVVPKEGQSLEEARALVMEQIENLKNGAFPDALLQALINDLKVQQIKSLESSEGLASRLYQSFIRNQSWTLQLSEIAQYEAITKEQIMSYARTLFATGVVEVHKLVGENPLLLRVENPGITPIVLNRDAKSAFYLELQSVPSAAPSPEFIEYSKYLQPQRIKGRKFTHLLNTHNELGEIHLIFPLGTDHDLYLTTALEFMQYLGTNKYTAEELKLKFFTLGLMHDVKIGTDQITFSLTGLEENLPRGLELLFHWITELKSEAQVYESFLTTINSSRQAELQDKGRIVSALTQFIKFQENSRLRHTLSLTQLQALDPQELVRGIHALLAYPYQVFFYGKNPEAILSTLDPMMEVPHLRLPEAKKFEELPTTGKVFYVPYDMVQVEMVQAARSLQVSPQHFGKVSLFNEYFGSGLSSVVFQEIREKRSLAYSAYAHYRSATHSYRHDYISSYIGTQTDKLSEARTALAELFKELPHYPEQFEAARQAALKQLASHRLRRTQIFFNALRLEKLGISYDIRQAMYGELQELDFNSFSHFADQRIREKTFNTGIIGDKAALQQAQAIHSSEVVELDVHFLFNY